MTYPWSEEARRLREQRIPCRQIAKIIGVSETTVRCELNPTLRENRRKRAPRSRAEYYGVRPQRPVLSAKPQRESKKPVPWEEKKIALLEYLAGGISRDDMLDRVAPGKSQNQRRVSP